MADNRDGTVTRTYVSSSDVQSNRPTPTVQIGDTYNWPGHKKKQPKIDIGHGVIVEEEE